MRSTIFALTLLSLLTLGLVPSCAGAPEGFTLSVQLSGVRMAAVDNVRLTLTPVPPPGGGVTPRFAMPETMSFEDGGVLMSTDDDGQLVILITGEYFRANAVPIGDGDLDPRLDLELWSDDSLMRMATPQIRGVVVADSFESAAGAAYLPSWPLELGGSFTVMLPCLMGRELQCRPPP